MSHWGADTASQPQAPGQVTFFDPTKFQKNAGNFPTIPTSQQGSGKGQAQQSQADVNNTQAGHHNAWDSWGNNPYTNSVTDNQVGDQSTGGNELSGYNQQQWYDHSQWGGNPEQVGQGQPQHGDQGQWDQQVHGQWDPNNGWHQNQYDYQQGADPNQTGYNGYWSGQDANYGEHVDWSTNISSANYYAADPSLQYAQSGTNGLQSNLEASAGSEYPSGQTDEHSSELNVSQSTGSEGQSLNQSIGNVEDGGTMGGFYNNDDYEDDEDSDDDDDEEEGSEEEEVVGNLDNNSSLGASGSHVQHEDEIVHRPEGSEVNIEQAGHENLQVDFTNQMQGLSIQDHSVEHSVEQQAVPNSSVPLYSNQRTDGNILTMGMEVPQHSFLPSQTEGHSGEVTGDNETNSETGKQTTPTFSDWEMVPPQGVASTHSRNPSTDNTVHFFISSTNSSARVSPATSTQAGDDHPSSVQEHLNEKKSVNQSKDHDDTLTDSVIDKAPKPLARPPPSVSQSLPPPPTAGVKKGGNPFRKSPNQELTPSSSGGDISMLSSTRLDVTKPNFENSPVVLDKSISPIQPEFAKRKTTDDESPELEESEKHSSRVAPDTPLSSHPKKVPAVSQSPIMPRKDGPFQPPGQEIKNKPVKASHDIGVRPVQQAPENVKSGAKDVKSERVSSKDQGRGPGRRTPDWDARDNHTEGRRTPNRDSRLNSDRDRRADDRDSDRYSRDRYGPDDRVSSRPPAGSDRGSSTRTRQSAFHHIQTSRNRNNVSPAASLLDVAESVPALTNILLMPASGSVSSVSQTSAPSELTPVASLISSMSEQITTEKLKDNGKDSRNRDSNGERDLKDRHGERDRYRDDRTRYTRDRDQDRGELRGNRSYDSLRDKKDSRNNSRERTGVYDSRESLDRDDSRDRTRRGDSRERDRSYRDDYYDRYRNRPPSRTSTVDTRRDYRDRDRDRESYRRTDRYDRDRPRSRQGERGDTERPRSRADYDREIEKYREKYKDYSYDEYYSRRPGYYDRQYYDYYHGNYAPGTGYYDEYGYYHDTAAPRYQFENYRRRSRTGTPGSLSDGGEEIASVTDKNKTSDSKSDAKRFDYPPGLHDYSQRAYDEYYSYYGYEQNGHRWDPNVSAWVATTSNPEVVPQRQTPEKFQIPHMRASFGPDGQLVRVLPNRPADGQPATIEIHDVQAMLEDNEESQCLKEFPGPLVRGDTHKNDVLLFCQTKAKACTENMDLPDRDSAELIWRFLELLIKQNGTIVGTDIADLILQGHEPTTQDYRRSGMKIDPSLDNLDILDNDSEDSQRISRGSTPIDRSVINKGKSLEEVTDRFRHLLMYGRKKDALDWAMKNNLWGHALFLASKMDSRAHANVMTRFANVAMRMNDPLQTLYQLMSGRQPAAVTSVGEERWGEWRPHLAMILSNHSHKPDLDRKSITTLGDTLASKGFLHASHFCYLMSQTGFGSYNKKSSKIVLIGSSHGLPLEYFATNEAIQCTEIYEYALSLANATVSLTNFQTFKYLYATRLSDCGFAQEALQYCEVISKHINMNPAYYPHILVKLVYDLACQLKFSHPQLEEDDEMPDPDWLRALHTTLVQFEEGAIQAVSGTVTPAFFGGRTTASSDSGEVGMYMQGADNGSMYTQDQSYMQMTGGMYSIHEQSKYSAGHAGVEGEHQNQGTEYSQGYDSTQQYKTEHVTGTDNHVHNVPGADNQHTHQYQQADNSYHHQDYTTDGQHGSLQWPDHQFQQQGLNSASQNHPDSHQNEELHQHQAIQNQWSNQHHFQPHKSGFHPDVNLSESQTTATSAGSGKRDSVASTSGFSQEDVEQDEGTDQADGGFNQSPGIFDIQATQTRIIPPKLRKRTISETSTGSGRDRHPSGNQGQTAQQKSQEDKDLISQPGKQKQAPGAGGIWGKIGGLFSRKNEMKLPDDKEPSIVWDPVKKRWVDKDADEQDEKPAAPPPKDHELPGTSKGIQAAAGPGLVPGKGPVASTEPGQAGGNKFSMRRGPKYVDVMNPKPASSSQVPSSLFHTLPNSRSAPAIFNPMGSQDVSSADTVPQDSIPEEKGAEHSPTTDQNLQLPPMNDNANASSAPSLTSTMPAMYNPTHFQQGESTFKQPAAPGPGHRLTNRRVYPKR